MHKIWNIELNIVNNGQVRIMPTFIFGISLYSMFIGTRYLVKFSKYILENFIKFTNNLNTKIPKITFYFEKVDAETQTIPSTYIVSPEFLQNTLVLQNDFLTTDKENTCDYEKIEN
jgi:hypothetical protein